jgi:photosystem II stability/assembly factor-like uncharacterized protein
MFWRDSGQSRVFGFVEWTDVLADHGPIHGKPATIWRITDSHVWGRDPYDRLEREGGPLADLGTPSSRSAILGDLRGGANRSFFLGRKRWYRRLPLKE